MDLLAPLPKDLAMMAAIRTTTEWQQKAKEGKRRKKQQKLRAQERGEETNSDDDDGEEEEEEVVANVEWDDLESEDTLIGIHLSMQGHFPFHVGGSESVMPAEAG